MAQFDRPEAWEQLARIALAMHRRCLGAEHVERVSPQSSGTFREISEGLRGQCDEFQQLLGLLEPAAGDGDR